MAHEDLLKRVGDALESNYPREEIDLGDVRLLTFTLRSLQAEIEADKMMRLNNALFVEQWERLCAGLGIEKCGVIEAVDAALAELEAKLKACIDSDQLIEEIKEQLHKDAKDSCHELVMAVSWMRNEIDMVRGMLEDERKAREEAERGQRELCIAIGTTTDEWAFSNKRFHDSEQRAEAAERMLADLETRYRTLVATYDAVEADWIKCESKLAEIEKETIERCAQVLDDLHNKVGAGWDYYSDERVDGAHNTLTNGAKLIRSLAQKGETP